MTWPILAGDAKESIWLGTDLMPGQWILQPGAKDFGWQEQKGWMLTGATLLAVGDPLVSFSFLVKFWKVADWNFFQQFRTKYLTRSAVRLTGTQTYAIGIIHPEINALGITSVVPVKTPFFVNSGKGLWSGTVELKQYRPPVIVRESPRATIPAAAPPNPSAHGKTLAEIADATKELTGAR